jgi:hypothetical protein
MHGESYYSQSLLFGWARNSLSQGMALQVEYSKEFKKLDCKEKPHIMCGFSLLNTSLACLSLVDF